MKSLIAILSMFIFVHQIYQINSQQSNSTLFITSNKTEFCIKLPIHNGNTTFCGIKTPWIPRISRIGGVFACLIPSLMAWISTGIVIFYVRRRIDITFENEDMGTEKRFCGCSFEIPFYVAHFLSVFNVYVSFYGLLIWDAIDVTLDSYLFYQLELGGIINENIARNSHVNNAILAFAILGSIKVFCFIMYGVDRDSREMINLKSIKRDQIWYAFLLEDGPELILEYFYIEKYVADRPPWYLFARDIFAAAIALYIIFDIIKWLCCHKETESESINPLYIEKGYPKLYTLFTLLIGVLMFLRVGGAGYQYVTGKLYRDCFKIEYGAIVQTPFESGCLREVDYMIIVLSCVLLLPVLIYGVFSIFFNAFLSVLAYAFKDEDDT